MFYFLTTHTYQHIHWSDCQYQRPGSCNRRTRSRWISPFLVEEERRSRGSGYQDNMTNTFGIKLTTLPPFIESSLQNLVGLKGTRSLFWLKVHILVKICERNKIRRIQQRTVGFLIKWERVLSPVKVCMIKGRATKTMKSKHSLASATYSSTAELQIERKFLFLSVFGVTSRVTCHCCSSPSLWS